MPGCSAYGCSNSDKKGFIMKVFPRDPARRAIWAEKVRRDQWEPTNRTHLCEAHFTEDQWEKTRVDGSRKLKYNAVPTIFSYVKISRKKKPVTIRRRSPPEKRHEDSVGTSVPLDKQATEPENVLHIEHNYGKSHFKDAAVRRAKKMKYSCQKPKLQARRLLKSSVESSVLLDETPTQLQELKTSEHNDEGEGAADVVVGVEQSVASAIPSQKRKHGIKRRPSPRKKLKIIVTSVVEHQPEQSQNLEQSTHQNGSSNATEIVERVEQHMDSVEEPPTQSVHQDGSNRATVLTERIEQGTYDSSTQTDNDLVANNRITFLETKLRDFEKYAAKLQGKVNSLGLKLRAKMVAEYRQRNSPKPSIEERLRSIFTEDQINRLQCSKKTMKWSSESIQMASALKSSCGKKGYKHLLDLGMPFPSFRTLRRMKQTAPEEKVSEEIGPIIVLQNMEENTIFV